jgi:hypothetical protein
MLPYADFITVSGWFFSMEILHVKLWKCMTKIYNTHYNDQNTSLPFWSLQQVTMALLIKSNLHSMYSVCLH